MPEESLKKGNELYNMILFIAFPMIQNSYKLPKEDWGR